jgi:hypothetical protein
VGASAPGVSLPTDTRREAKRQDRCEVLDEDLRRVRERQQTLHVQAAQQRPASAPKPPARKPPAPRPPTGEHQMRWAYAGGIGSPRRAAVQIGTTTRFKGAVGYQASGQVATCGEPGEDEAKRLRGPSLACA